MQIGEEGIENLLVNMVLSKINKILKHGSKNTQFHVSFSLEWVKQILTWKLSKWYLQLWIPKGNSSTKVVAKIAQSNT
jgi:hypothetical protein